MSQNLKNRGVIPARVQPGLTIQLPLVNDRHKKIDSAKQQCPAKIRRPNADDGERMLVQLNCAPQHPSISVEMAVPIRVAQHDIRCAVWPMLIGAVEEMAKIRLNPQHIEVVPARCKTGGKGGLAARVQPDKGEVKCGQTFKAVVAIAQIGVVGIRLPPGAIPVLASIKGVRLGHIQRAQDQTIQYAKHHGVRANRQSQRQNGGDCETGRLAQQAESEPRILHERFKEDAAHRFMAFFPVPLIAAELDARASFCLGTIQAGALKIIRAELNMGAKLIVHFIPNLGTMEKLSSNGTNPVQESHTSSGCGASADPMAVANRFQLSVSSRRRLWPAAVSS